MKAPAVRVRAVNDAPVRSERGYVLYWMTSARRTRYNFGLEHAASWARELGKPLLVLEALRAGYRWASDRFHQFVLAGMDDNETAFAKRGVRYLRYVEPRPGDGRGLLASLAADACVVVTDDFPAFFLPRMHEAAGAKMDVLLEAVDSNGLLPLRATSRVFTTAHSFRAFLQKELPTHLEQTPARDPLRNLPTRARIKAAILRKWPSAENLESIPIDHSITPVAGTPGGARAARERWRDFLDVRLHRYDEDRNHPTRAATSGMSPYLHFGHIGAHELFADLTAHHDWGLEDLGARTDGTRSGWWGLPESTEAFLDQLITWREIGFNRCAHTSHYDRYESLPAWAQKTLERHAEDPREYDYDLDALQTAQTHDEIWNAAQTQLVTDGIIHNYLRMLWGKKILEWTPNPRVALEVLIELNNRFALDGRDPSSYSGIFWVLGRYDRAWGPERPIFGKVRYMSSANTARKLQVTEYLEQHRATF